MSVENKVVEIRSDSKTNAATDDPSSSVALSSGDLGAIQDLLYGRQLRATTQQIDELRSSMERRFEELSAKLDSRITDVESKIEANRISTQKQIHDQTSAQMASVSELKNTLRGSELNLENRIKAANESLHSNHMNVKSDLDDCRNTLTHSIRSTQKDIELELELVSRDLDARKLDRDALSGLLGGIAGQLSSPIVKHNVTKPDNSNKPGTGKK